MMKKLVVTVLLEMFVLTGCNKQVIDMNYTFNYAQIEGIGKIEIKAWNDYGDSDMVQVISKDGTTYLTHSSNVILTNK